MKLSIDFGKYLAFIVFFQVTIMGDKKCINANFIQQFSDFHSKRIIDIQHYFNERNIQYITSKTRRLVAPSLCYSFVKSGASTAFMPTTW